MIGKDVQEILSEHAQWLDSGETRGRRADLSGVELDGMCLAGANLSGASLRGASLRNADLSASVLTHADFSDANLHRANLKGANLLLTDFSGADLSQANLSETADAAGESLGHVRRGPRFAEADLSNCDLSRAYCEVSDFTGARLQGVSLQGAMMREAKLTGCDLSNLDLSHAELTDANLHGASLVGADLRRATLQRTHLRAADMTTADLRGADLRAADFSDARVDGIRYDRAAIYRGVRVATCYGSSLFRRYAQDQDYIEEIKQSQPAFYWLWLSLTDCGRSMIRVMLWSLGLSLVFGTAYFLLGQEHFAVANSDSMGWSIFTAFYYSVVTFTTLGYGDVTPATPLAAAIVMVEVVVGYLMLGILISILATKVARRS